MYYSFIVCLFVCLFVYSIAYCVRTRFNEVL